MEDRLKKGNTGHYVARACRYRGGGIAGLTAGIHAALAGFAVTLIEKNEKCGGLVNSFVRDGFLFDGGTRALEGFLFSLLKRTDIMLDFVHTPVSISVEDSVILIKDAETGLDRKILFHFAATPLTIETIGGSFEGSVIGWFMKEPVPVTSSMLRMTEAVQTAIPSVYKAGQWTMSPAGIPTAVMTGLS